LHVDDRFAVHFSNDVLALDVLLGSEAVVRDIGDDDALLNIEVKAFSNLFG